MPWTDFPAQQMKTWELIHSSTSFTSERAFPSSHQLDYVKSTIDPIDSELKVRSFAWNTVENAVQRLVKEVGKDEDLRVRLQAQWTVAFDSHTNLEKHDSSNDETNEVMREPVPISQPVNVSDGHPSGASGAADRSAISKPARRRRGKGGQADEFCIYRQTSGQSIPAAVIEYKAPHKLTPKEITVGLSGEIWPDRDVIGREGESFELLSKCLLTAVITQCFSYMIDEGVQHGYLFTGQAIVFLKITDDPITVYYYLCVPNLDVQEAEENRLHRTAVAQVFAFVLRALAAEPAPQAWHDATLELKTWAVKYIDILKMIPETERKSGHEGFTYKPQRWKSFQRSPIRTRSQCLLATHKRRDGDSSNDDDDVGTQPPLARTLRPTRRSRAGKVQQPRETPPRRSRRGADIQDSSLRPRIEDREYCSHECFLGLVHGEALDEICPNIQFHKKGHTKLVTFLNLVQLQLAQDRGKAADCKPLYVRGAVGALFKIRLLSHGYTFVAKGGKQRHLARLQREYQVYKHPVRTSGHTCPRMYWDNRAETSILLRLWAI